MGSQGAGFFIDEDNRILYWPAPEGAGYELDYAASKQIQKMRHNYLNHWIPNVFLLICGVGVFYNFSVLYPYVENLINPINFYAILIFGPYTAFLLLFWRFFGFLWFLQDASYLLREDNRLYKSSGDQIARSGSHKQGIN